MIHYMKVNISFNHLFLLHSCFLDDPKSSQLTTITQRTSPTATPKNTSHYHKSDARSSSSKKSFSSPNKIHYRNRHTKPSSSSSSSLASTNSEKNHHHHRISSHPENIDHHRKTYPTRNEGSQTINNLPNTKNEQEQTDDQFLLEQFSDQTPNNILHAPLDQVKHLYEQTLLTSTPFSKSSSPMTILFDKYPNRNGVIPLNNHAIDFRRKRTDLIPAIKTCPAFDENIYRIF